MVYTGALTLTQYMLQSNDPLIRAITYSMIMAGTVMQDIPFVTRRTLYANGLRFEGNLPSPTWASLNDSPVSVTSTPTPYQEQAYMFRNKITVDHILVMDENQIADPRSVQVGAALRGFTYDFNDKFINNSHVPGLGDPKSFVGLRGRIDNGTKYGVRSENKIDGGGVVMTGSATAATFGAFCELLDQLLWSVDSPDGTGVVLYMNEQLIRRFSRLSRQFSGQGGFSTATDQLGRTTMMYQNALIRDAGYKGDQATRIITSTETSAGVNGSDVYTSVYAVNFGPMHLSGWQFFPLMAQDQGLDNDGIVYNVLLEWVGGLFSSHTRSIGRLFGVKMA